VDCHRTIYGRIERIARVAITANHLKTRGVSIIEQSRADSPETIISVRGKDRYRHVPGTLPRDSGDGA
jgi:hypothetical protein